MLQKYAKRTENKVTRNEIENVRDVCENEFVILFGAEDKTTKQWTIMTCIWVDKCENSRKQFVLSQAHFLIFFQMTKAKSKFVSEPSKRNWTAAAAAAVAAAAQSKDRL